MNEMSRRDFLKLSGLALTSLAAGRMVSPGKEFADIEMVRVAYRQGVSVYKEPDDGSRIVATWPRDTLMNVYETVNSGTPAYNPIWYRVFGGYMHRSRLQKVRWHFNEPPAWSGEKKLLGEVTVPYTQPFRYSEQTGWSGQTFFFYYSTIHWIVGIENGPDGKPWYRLQDEADKNIFYLIPAIHLRIIQPEELTPLAPEVENKFIEVNLTSQTLICYENNSEVFRALISSGARYLYDTPAGRFNILVKLPARRMSAADLAASDDENVLAGVPWCGFFTTEGHAFHGTYWHDNFGMTMSHGCINMRNEDALWLFRWSMPSAAFAEIDQQTFDRKGHGTRVEIHY